MAKVKLGISDISPGMKLAEPIINDSGITLMPSGIRLTPMFIVRLKKWNVEELTVLVEKSTEKEIAEKPAQAVGQAAGLSADQEEFARLVVADISKCFVNVKDNPLMMQLRTVAIKKLIAHGKNGVINTMRMVQKHQTEGTT